MRLPTGRDDVERQTHRILELEDQKNLKHGQDIELQGADIYVYDSDGNRYSLRLLVEAVIGKKSVTWPRSGSYVITGSDVTLTETGDQTLTASGTSYTITGSSVTLRLA